MRRLPTSLFILMFIAFFCRATAGEWDARLSGEAGYFKAGHDLRENNVDYLTAFNATFKYTLSNNPHFLNLQLRLRPEWYGPHEGIYSMSGSFAAQYQRQWGRLLWSAGANIRKQNHHIDQTQVWYNTYQGSTGWAWKWSEWMSTDLEGSYTLLDLAGDADDKINLYAIRFRIHRLMAPNLNVTIGAYAERFITESNVVTVSPLPERNSNKGWHRGSEIELEYTKKIQLNVRYGLSWFTSQLTKGTAPEQQFYFVAGKTLAMKWSVFFLLDYYWRNINPRASYTGALLYTNANNERNVHFKLAYNLSSRRNVYTKIAYQNSELIYNNIKLSGTQLSLGFESKF
ncbi:hypothetical protein K1X84_01845 [bacterium]|nr:hypothetical protein [bacterium]